MKTKLRFLAFLGLAVCSLNLQASWLDAISNWWNPAPALAAGPLPIRERRAALNLGDNAELSVANGIYPSITVRGNAEITLVNCEVEGLIQGSQNGSIWHDDNFQEPREVRLRENASLENIKNKNKPRHNYLIPTVALSAFAAGVGLGYYLTRK